MPATQAPVWHASPTVHALPSLQAVPSGRAGFEHTPVDGLQLPTSWHWSRAAQATGFWPVQVPAWHVSVWVQASASLHEVPSGFVGFEHAPVAGLQVPASWQWSSAVQTTGLPAVHEPVALQVSAPLQAFPSEQLVPAATGTCCGWPFASHMSVVHGLPSSIGMQVGLKGPNTKRSKR